MFPSFRSRSLSPLAALLLAALPNLRGSAQNPQPPSTLSPAPALAPGASPAHAAPVTVVVFSDFQCPYSSSVFFTLEKLKHRYGTQLHVLYRDSPLPIHPDAPLAHRAAIAADRQGKREEMSELLYASQQNQSRAVVLAFAQRLHLDMTRFRRDLDSTATAAEVNRSVEESDALGIDQTPTLFVNGTKLVGTQSEATLSALLDGKSAPSTLVPPAVVTVEPALVAAMEAHPTAVRGADRAPVTIVEFTDFQCPFCRAAVEPMEQLMAARGQQVRWVFRAFPLDFHPDAQLAAEAALAAGAQGKFWEMHDLLFANQRALGRADLDAYAAQLGLDTKLFREALDEHRYAGEIAADRALGDKAGVTGTPTFVLDGQVLSGARSLPELTAWVDAHTAGSNAVLAGGASGTPLPDAPPEYRVSGPASAPLTLTWFTDVRSPLAARQAELVQALAARYGDRLRAVYKPFPLASHADARLGSAALLAALQQDRFWPMFHALAARPEVLDEAALLAVAHSLGLQAATFQADLHRMEDDLGSNIEEATRRGIMGAPVMFLNDQRIDGLQREEFYTRIADAELTKASPAGTAIAAKGQ